MTERDESLLELIIKKNPGSCFTKNIDARFSDIKNPLFPEQFSEEAEKFFFQAEKIMENSGNDSSFFFKIRAVADALVYKRKGWLDFLPASLFKQITGLAKEMAVNFSWTYVPCLFANQSNSFVRFLICGIMENSDKNIFVPEWGRALMDNNFFDSIKNAYELSFDLLDKRSCVKFSLYCFPLSILAGSTVFNGDSAGLAIYLGIKSLLNKRHCPLKIAATGKIKDGRICNVGFICEKMILSKKYGFEYFFYPAENPLIESAYAYPVKCIQPSDPESAFLLSRLDDHDIKTINRIHDCLASPEKFALLCGSIPEIGFELEQNRINSLALEISASPELFKKFILGFRLIIKSAKFKTARHIVSVFNDIIESSTNIDSVSKFEWFCLNLEMTNHSGNIELACQCTEKARNLLPDVIKTPEGRDLFKWLSNHEFVNKRHNHYIFRPEMPEGFQEMIEKTEQVFAINAAGIDGASDPALASIYGTVAQNYAFCGAGFLDKSIYYSKKAIGLFGGIHAGRLPDTNRDDCLRQYNYMTYAFLDAEDYINAEKHFFLYFEKKSLTEAFLTMDSFTEWKHALFARFIADTENTYFFDTYLSFCEQNDFSFVSEKHPWQLWYYNMARMAMKAGKAELSKKIALKSISVCESKNAGSTIKVMALLPLSLLYVNHLTDKKELVDKSASFVETALSINPVFFGNFSNESTESVLNTINRHPEKFFPFSYR